ncbi:MAG: ATP-dependent DNA helicase RecG [Candidatus Pacebacteria bacterium]|nr:ATP-dependent DNA helicase RecG [Candidatus Paceibacterota bacterium]
MISLSTPLTQVKGIGLVGARLAKLGLATIKDVLYYFPFRYQDFSTLSTIADLKDGNVATVCGTVEKVSVYRTPRKKMWIVQVVVRDETGLLFITWFNQKFIAGTLKQGMEINVAGKAIAEGKKMTMQSPTYEIISQKNTTGSRHTGRLVPIYSETPGITSRGIRFALSKIMPLVKDIPEFLPDDIVESNSLLSLSDALQKIHFPTSIEEAQTAQHRFAFQDLFLLQLVHGMERARLTRQPAHSFAYDPGDIKKRLDTLPFELTLSQKKALVEILDDLKKPYPTNRLLQGDVGSGKTIVAALAALVVVQQGKQVVFMAPTEVLAAQHYATFKKFFKDVSNGVALMTASQAAVFFGDGLESQQSKKEVLSEIKKGEIAIIIGTHSVIQKHVEFNDVAFVVIDEQHRFGVSQRFLLSRASALMLPHLLSMSATPIPRTLALTVFGDLNLSIINELPKNRKGIITKIVPPTQRNDAYEFIRKHIRSGHQAFVICPRIDQTQIEADKTLGADTLFSYPNVSTSHSRASVAWEVKSVVQEYEKLSQKVFPDLRVGMLHGRLKAKEKQDIMRRFQEGVVDILISTSVVEVGVDVPNATIMMIEGSEHFGLSQLYQFRGRVGRSDHQSYCFLFTDIQSATTHERMKAVVNAKSGFELAEIDLKLRGPGQFLGQEQTGLPDLAMKAIQNPLLVQKARSAAANVISRDPLLKRTPYLLAYVNLFKDQIHLE